MTLTWYGTASLLISSENSQVLIDPFIPMRGGPLKVDIDEYSKHTNILITHAHFDHIGSLPLFIDKSKKIYGTQAVATSLAKLMSPDYNFIPIKPNDEFNIDDLRIQVFKSKHSSLDTKLRLRTIFSFRHLFFIPNLITMSKLAPKCKENKEIIAYLISNGTTSIFILGSLGIDENTTYPNNVDYLVLPYQGCSDLKSEAIKIIDTIQPKNIIIDHCDDTFPSLTKKIDTSEIEKEYTNITFHKLQYKKMLSL
ncbi:MAG: MBL fold metallo-hydrolase [Clostridia bacterium]|nr:MBL fold metallo-hydrolase [Clostridia bacterium]